MIDPTIYTFTAAELAKRDVEMKREGYVRGRMGPPRGQVPEGFIEMEKRGAAEIFPYPTRSLREEPDPQTGKSFRYRYFDGVIEDHESAGWTHRTWRATRQRITLWHDLMLRPWQCDGCGAPLASETEEHQCP